MYDILQLNDMLVPELLDIAEQLNIPNAKKLDKQGLVYKILDGQAIAGAKNNAGGEDKGRRKRIIKATTAHTTEEAVVEDGSAADKKGQKKSDEKGASETIDDEGGNQATGESSFDQIQEAPETADADAEAAASDNALAPAKPSYPQRRE